MNNNIELNEFSQFVPGFAHIPLDRHPSPIPGSQPPLRQISREKKNQIFEMNFWRKKSRISGIHFPEQIENFRNGFSEKKNTE